MLASCVMGCQTSVRIPDAPPPVETDPVMPIAGYGMELRLWDLDATSWRLARSNAELTALFEQWLNKQAEQESEASGSPPSPDEPVRIEPALGPPVDIDEAPATFEAFVHQRSETRPERPGREQFLRFSSLRGTLDPSSEEVWRRNGMEFALVPVTELAALRAAMGVPAPLERTWWGSTTAWSRMLGTRWMRDRRIETDLGPLELGTGQFGIVGRAWAAPGVGEPVLRLDLCPQFVPRHRRESRLESRLSSRLQSDAGPRDARADGALFERLLLQAAIPRGYALVIAAAPRLEATDDVGPMVESASLGEALFSRRGPGGREQTLALVIVPVLPEWFALDGN